MQEHVLDDGVGTFAVLDDFFEIVFQKPRQFVDLFPHLFVKRGRLEHIIELIGQFRRQRGEIINKIERVLDLVCDAGGELAERGQFFGLH
jgi:hypothetical protein